jgi:hypothetical protein
MTELPHDPKPWMWSVTDPDLAGRPGWSDTHGETGSRRQAMARVIERWQELRALSLAPLRAPAAVRPAEILRASGGASLRVSLMIT